MTPANAGGRNVLVRQCDPDYEWNHYRSVSKAYEIPLLVFFDLWIKAFFSERPVVRISLEASSKSPNRVC